MLQTCRQSSSLLWWWWLCGAVCSLRVPQVASLLWLWWLCGDPGGEVVAWWWTERRDRGAGYLPVDVGNDVFVEG